MRDEQRQDFKTMQAISPFTKLTPDQRIKDCQKMIEKFNNNDDGLIKIGQAKRMPGFILDRPELQFGGQKLRPDDKGSIRNRSKLKNPPKIKDWVFVYSVGKSRNNDDDDADKAVGLLTKAGKTYGIDLQDPGFLVVEGRSAKDWKKVIEDDIKKNSKP